MTALRPSTKHKAAPIEVLNTPALNQIFNSPTFATELQPVYQQPSSVATMACPTSAVGAEILARSRQHRVGTVLLFKQHSSYHADVGDKTQGACSVAAPPKRFAVRSQREDILRPAQPPLHFHPSSRCPHVFQLELRVGLRLVEG